MIIPLALGYRRIV